MGLKHFNKQKLRNKLLIIYLVGFLFPILAINSIFSYNMYKKQIEFERQHYKKTIENTQLVIQNKINNTLQIIYTVYISRDLSTFLQNSYKSMSQYMINRDKAFSILNQLRLRNDTFRIYTTNQTIQSDPIISQLDYSVTNMSWYITSRAKKRAANLFYTKTDPNIISIIRPLDFNIHKSSSWNNVIKADIKLDQIKNKIEKIDLNYGLSLISSAGQVVVDNNKIKKNYNTINVEFSEKSLLAGWKLVGRIPKPGMLAFIQNGNKTRLFVPQTLIAIIGSIFIFLLSRSFYTRIYKLSNKMKSVEEGDFRSIKIDQNQNDEITKLSLSYNIMVNKIYDLIHEVSEAKLREKNIELVKNQAQLNALRSQINPHYLFNVLESIRMKSLIKDEKETAYIIKHLSKSYRHIISWDQNLITLNRELEIAKDFLTVQKYRFEDKLDYEFNIDERCLDFSIPKLTLQPFIENSCIHGIEKSSQNGIIVVNIYYEDQNLICIINDNGIGISQNKLEELKSSIENFEIGSSHIGFKNTYWRLKKHYSGFNLNIDSKEGVGTTITLSIPLIEEKEQIVD